MVTMRVEGLDQIVAKLHGTVSLATERRIIRNALRQGSPILERQMERLAPRGDPESPNLAESITTSNSRYQDDIAAIKTGPSREVDYGRFQEFGTARHRAQSFARPTFDSSGPQVVGIVKDALWRDVIVRGLATARASGGGGGLL